MTHFCKDEKELVSRVEKYVSAFARREAVRAKTHKIHHSEDY